MENLYEIIEQRNKEIEALKREIEKLEENKAYFENRIREEERNSSNDLTKEIIASKVQDLQNKIDNFHFKNKLKIENDTAINKLSLVYYCAGCQSKEISTSGASMLHELEKWINFQSEIIPIYKFLEDMGDNLIYVRAYSLYNDNHKGSILTFKYNYENKGLEEILYLLSFNKLDYSTFDLIAYKKILSNAVKGYLSLDNKGLRACVITPEAEREFDNRDFDPDEDFNIYLEAIRKNIDVTMLKNIIEETTEQILSYTDFKECYY